MGIFLGVTINNVHMLRDLGLALSRTDCVQPPRPKANSLDIPGADGAADLTENMSGRTVYHNREIRMEFGRGLKKEAWPGMYSRILALFHGKKVKVIFDDDRDYYYTGRAAVSDYKRIQMLGTMLVTVDAEPYKYELYGGLERWKWGPFNLETGIIRNYKDRVVNGELIISVPGKIGAKHIVPVIISSAAMTVVWNGEEYSLVAGRNKIYDILLGEGENILTFRGKGTISIDYNGGIL